MRRSEKNFQNVDGCRFLDAHETQACTGDNRERGRQPEPARELELELVHGEHRTGEDGDNDSVTDKTPANVEKGRGSSPEVHGVLGEVNGEPEAATGRGGDLGGDGWRASSGANQRLAEERVAAEGIRLGDLGLQHRYWGFYRGKRRWDRRPSQDSDVRSFG
jgi:hypothetical protein